MEKIKDGIYYLTGVDRYTEEELRRVLDNAFIYGGENGVAIELQPVNEEEEPVVYVATEDACDGYRSHGDFFSVPGYRIKNKFEKEKVRVFTLEGETKYGSPWELTEIRSYYDNSLICKVGTENYNDWYPCAIFEWRPENLSVNKW